MNEHIRVLPTHPLYHEVLAACLAKETHDATRWAKRTVATSQEGRP
jgi:hypothetical protein